MACWVRGGGHVCPLDGKSISFPLRVFTAAPCLGPGGTLHTAVTAPRAAGANQLKLLALDDVGGRLLRPGLRGEAPDPGACAAEAVTLAWENPTFLLSPVPCPWGGGGGGAVKRWVSRPVPQARACGANGLHRSALPGCRLLRASPLCRCFWNECDFCPSVLAGVQNIEP